MENEQEPVSGVTRGQNQLHLSHVDWGTAARAITPLFDRVTAAHVPQVLVVTADAESAAGIAERLAPAIVERGLRVLAATTVRRASRVYRQASPDVLLGDARTIAALMQAATLKLDTVKAIVLAWVDDLAGADKDALETLMADAPKDAARVVLAASATPDVEALVERYARRPRRVNADAADAPPPVSLSFVTVGESGRPSALRRVLDAMDPESAQVLVNDDASRDAARSVLRSLGYGEDADPIKVVDAAPEGGDLLVLYDVQPTAQALRAAVAARSGGRVIALVTPRQIESLRRQAGGMVAPFPLPEAAKRAQSREDAMRDELRQILESGTVAREVLALQPLLSDFDGTEIAAAALRLLETERAKGKAPLAADAPRPMTRLYVNVGETDGVRAGDLVGAITNEAGIARSEIGRVEVRDRHSTVEVATPIANNVVSKLTGVTIGGRRAIARVDEGPPQDRGGRPPRPRRDDRGPRRDDARGPRGPRTGGTRDRMGSSGRPPTSPGARGKR